MRIVLNEYRHMNTSIMRLILVVCFLISVQLNKIARSQLSQTLGHDTLIEKDILITQGRDNVQKRSTSVKGKSLNQQCIASISDTGIPLCKSKACKNEASYLLSNLDHNIDPDSIDYNNIYDYACGGMRKNERFSDEDPRNEIFKKIEGSLNRNNKSSASEKNLKIFYDTCLNYVQDKRHIEKAKAFLFDKLKLKFLAINEQIDVDQFTNTMKTLIELDSLMIFKVGLDIDRSNTKKLSLKLTVNLDSYLFEAENVMKSKCNKKIQNNIKDKTEIDVEAEYKDYNKYKKKFLSFDYIKSIEEALKEFKIDQVEEILKNVMGTTKRIYQTFVGRYRDKGDETEPFSITIKYLQDETGKVNWKSLFGALLKKEVDENTRIQLYCDVQQFSYLLQELQNSDLRKLNNALLAHLLHNIYNNFIKPEKYFNRRKYCLEIMSELIPDATTNLIVDNIGKQALEEQDKQVQKIRESISKTLLEEFDKVAGLDKASIKNKQLWLNKESLEAVKMKTKQYSTSLPSRLVFDNQFDFDKHQMKDNYFDNAMDLIERKQKMLFSIYNTESKSPKVIWMLYKNSFSRHSIYIHEINTIAIPETILLKHNKELPDAINMARLGYVIAKGLISAFDKKGVRFNHENNNTLILTKGSFTTHSQAIEEFKFKQTSLEIVEDGKRYNLQQMSALMYSEVWPTSPTVIDEKMSDISATKLAFETLKRQKINNAETLLWGEFDREQLFFLTLAQEFCTKKTFQELLTEFYENEMSPSFIRINNIFFNSAEFNSAFKNYRATEHSLFQVFPYLIKHESGKPESLGTLY